MSPDFIAYRNLAFVVLIVVLLWSLSIILCREWVKRDLRQKGMTPLNLRWRPFASSKMVCAFRVRFLDPQGLEHTRNCRVFWLNPQVRWDHPFD